MTELSLAYRRWLERHRATDPHCTCNDCIAYEQRQETHMADDTKEPPLKLGAGKMREVRMNRDAQELTRGGRRLLRSHLRSIISECEDLIERLQQNNPNDDETIGEEVEEIEADAEELVATYNRLRTGRES